MAVRPTPEVGRGTVRTAVVWDTITQALQTLGARPDRPDALEVVDLGGGTGGLAVRIAELGHRVCVVDPSPDALASLHRRAVESGVDGRVRGVQGDAADLVDHVGGGAADLVLCHGVLEVVDDPAEALVAIGSVLRPDGFLSVTVAGRLSAVVSRALAGEFERARTLLAARAGDWDVRHDGPRRYAREEIESLLSGHGFALHQVDAVRVFSDLVPSEHLDGEPGARHALLELERAVAALPEFGAMASQLHLVVRRG